MHDPLEAKRKTLSAANEWIRFADAKSTVMLVAKEVIDKLAFNQAPKIT